MIIVLKQNAPDVQVHEFCRELEGMGLQINDSKGSDTHILGLIGTVSSILGHFIGAGLAIKNGSKIVKPAIILVLILLAAKVVQGLIAG